MKKNIFFFLIGVILFSCGRGNNEFEIDEKNNLTGSKWTLTNWDYSLGDEYIGLHNDTYKFFFHSNKEGVFYYGRKDNYSDQNASNQRVACHFKYVISGNYIFLEYITDKYLNTTKLELSGNTLKADNFIFEYGTISGTDNQWLNSVSGTTGSCSWYSDMRGGLWIAGDGAMSNYSHYSATPWAKNNRTPNKMVILEGVTAVGSYAFANSSISKVEMPEESLEQIGNAAFKGSSINNIIISQSTQRIGQDAFADCTYLKDINLPESLISIGECAFTACPLNEFQMNFGSNLRSIGKFAFEGGKATFLTFAEGIQSISTGAFLGDYCSISKELALPNSLISIGSNVFEGTYKKIVLGNGLKEIGDRAFISGATSGEMYVNLSTPPSTGSNIIVEPANWSPVESNWTLYVPKGCKAAYSNKSPWNKFKSIIEDSSLEGRNK